MEAFNYDATASIDDGSCTPKLYGCMDTRAVNYNATANTYDATGGNGTRELCYGAYCALGDARTLCPYGDDAGHVGTCTCPHGGAPTEYGPAGASMDECDGSDVTQCLASVHRLCDPSTGAGHPTTWTILPKYGPNDLGLRYNVPPAHQMGLITSGRVPVRLRWIAAERDRRRVREPPGLQLLGRHRHQLHVCRPQPLLARRLQLWLRPRHLRCGCCVHGHDARSLNHQLRADAILELGGDDTVARVPTDRQPVGLLTRVGRDSMCHSFFG